jgi:hypothetical protein
MIEISKSLEFKIHNAPTVLNFNVYYKKEEIETQETCFIFTLPNGNQCAVFENGNVAYFAFYQISTRSYFVNGTLVSNSGLTYCVDYYDLGKNTIELMDVDEEYVELKIFEG